jgi:ribosomal protein S14
MLYLEKYAPCARAQMPYLKKYALCRVRQVPYLCRIALREHFHPEVFGIHFGLFKAIVDSMRGFCAATKCKKMPDTVGSKKGDELRQKRFD